MNFNDLAVDATQSDLPEVSNYREHLRKKIQESDSDVAINCDTDGSKKGNKQKKKARGDTPRTIRGRSRTEKDRGSLPEASVDRSTVFVLKISLEVTVRLTRLIA